MPQTDPFSYNAPNMMTDAELARALRLDAAAELDATSLYEAHIDATNNEDAKKILAFIAKDEKEHYALFVELIKRLDPDQAEELDGARLKLDAILSLPAGAATEGAVDQAVEQVGEGEGAGGSLSGAAQRRDLLRRTTVGSLLGEIQP
jgi:rubrerythrin